MAIAFFRATECAQNAAQKYDYDNRQGRHEGTDLVASGNQNLPSWAQAAPRKFWSAADRNEKGNKCKTIIIAMPKELDNTELEVLAKDACSKLFDGHATTWAIHRPKGRLSGEDNPHLHVMVCERLIDPTRPDLEPEKYFKKTRTLKNGTLSGGYAKDKHMTKTDRRKWLQETKEKWEGIANHHLEQSMDRIPSYFGPVGKAPQIHFPARKMDRKSRSVHLGPRVMVRMLKGQPTKIGARWADQVVGPIMRKRNRAHELAKISNTDGVEVEHFVWSYIRHPLNKEKRRKMLINYRVQDADELEKKVIRRDIKYADDAATTALQPKIKQLNALARWGRKNNVGDGVAHYPGRWQKSFDFLIARQEAKEADEKRAMKEARRKAELAEIEERKVQIEKKEAAERRAREEAELQRRRQQTASKPVREQQTVVFHTNNSRGRGRSR